MSRTHWFRPRSKRSKAPHQTRLHVELLETRNLLSSSLGLTPLVQVSGDSPLPPPPPPPPTVFYNSEVEPQIAVDPMNTAHADDWFSASSSACCDGAPGATFHWSNQGCTPASRIRTASSSTTGASRGS